MGLIATGSSPPLPAFAVPHKRGWRLIPGPRGLLKPAPDLLGAVRVLPVQRAALEHTLDRRGPVEPAAAHRCIERHNPMRAQPQHQVGRLVASQIVPHQQQPQRRQILRSGEGSRQARLPHRPRGPRHGGIPGGSRRRHRCEDRTQVLAQPRVQDRMGAAGGWLQPHLAGGGMEQGQDLGRAAPDGFVRLRRRSPARLPRHTRMRHGLKGTGLVLTPDREPKLRPQRVGLLDQLFLAIASGSLTRTTPCLRWRITTPVSHQVRLVCPLRPPACKVRQIV
jgi:hypothetical protein